MHGKELQVYGAAMAVVVANSCNARADGGMDAQLFFQLAGQCLFGTFAVLDLAAGKLPQPRHRLIGASLTNQNFAATHDQRRRYKAKCGARAARRGFRLVFFHTFSLSELKELYSPATAASTPSANSGRK